MEGKKNFFEIIKVRRGFLVLSVILPVVLGIMAGVAGELLSRAYISDDAYSPPFWREVDLSNDYRGSNLVIRDAKKVVVEQDIKVAETINSVESSAVGIFKKQSVKGAKGGFNVNDYYRVDQALGAGLIITSDGWILTEALPNLNSQQISSDYVVIAKDKKIYNIDKAVKDPASSFYFIHISGVRDLPIRQFADSDELTGGQLTIALAWPDNAWLTSLTGSKSDSSVISSESSKKKFTLADNAENYSKNGALIFDLSGNAAGLADKNGKFNSINSFSSALTSLLRSGNIKRPLLGINFIDLSSFVPANSAQKTSDGALIIESETRPAVIKGSAADLAGIAAGDIITAIDNKEIKNGVSVNDILENYIAGDKINIHLIRAGQPKEIEVKLGELK